MPRVAPEDLDRLQPHDLVKVSFRLQWILADQAAQEFRPVLSSKARLLALKTTNRLEAIDSVENLKQLAEILDEEQGQGGGDRLVKEFDLRSTRHRDSRTTPGVPRHEEGLGRRTVNAEESQRQMFTQRMQQMMGQRSERRGGGNPAAKA